MLSILLCLVCFAGALALGRRSLRAGLLFVISVGYVYGILRANLNEAGAHFIFDAAVAGFYVAYFGSRERTSRMERTRHLIPWLLMLCCWPIFLFFMPFQSWSVQLVGLRAAVFFMPFLLIGSQIKDEDLRFVTIGVAVLNVVALVVGSAEYFFGVEPFFPKNAMTELIYRSRVLDTAAALRIPSIFSGAHAYASTMVMSLPWLVDVWSRATLKRWQTYLLPLAIGAAFLGVFLSATRTHLAIALVVLLAMVLSLKLRTSIKAAIIGIFVLVAYLGLQGGRVERFNTLQDADTVTQRFRGSVNVTFLDALAAYPMGNGLGGGGTSLPYFLQGQLVNPVMIENEYARISLEQGIPGLLLWLAFLVWLFGSSGIRLRRNTRVGPRLAWIGCAAYFALSLLGTGLLTSIPHTIFLLLSMGWLSAVSRDARPEGDLAYAAQPTLAYERLSGREANTPALR